MLRELAHRFDSNIARFIHPDGLNMGFHLLPKTYDLCRQAVLSIHSCLLFCN